MASFSSTAFSVTAFSVSAWNFGSLGGQSRSHRQWTRQELDSYKEKDIKVYLIAVKEPKLVAEIKKIVAEVDKKPVNKNLTQKEQHRLRQEQIKAELYAYLLQERREWQKEYDRIIALEYKLSLQQRKEYERVETQRRVLVRQRLKVKHEKRRKALAEYRQMLIRQAQEEEEQIILLLFNM